MKTLLFPNQEKRKTFLNFACTIVLAFACSQSILFAQVVGPNATVTMPSANSSLTATYKTDMNTSFHNLSSLSTSVYVYPNPANNIIQIQGADFNSNYEIYSILGTKLQCGKLGKTIVISGLNPGVYFIFVENKAYRFVKQSGKL